VLLRRRKKRGRWAPPTALFEVLFTPAKPTLHGALAYANKLAFGHALGFDPEEWSPPRSGLAVKDGRAPRGDRVAIAQLWVSRGLAEPLPSVKVSASAAASFSEELRWALRCARGAAGSIFLYSEVIGVPLTLEGDDVPWPAFARGREGLYVPGFEALIEAFHAEREGLEKLVLCDWKRWERKEGSASPTPTRMLLALGKCSDGRAVYILWVSRGGGAPW